MIGNDLHKSLNEQAAVMIQIETLEAINNLDAMLTECPDVDMVWLGSLDCRVSMGLGANFFGGTELEWLAAEQKFIDTLRKHNKPRGGFAFGAAALPTIREKGFAAVWYDGDVIRLLSMPADLAKARELVAIKDKGEGGEGGAEVAGGKDIA
jgi:2-keto-3-deoxy-L-rhamnonate aldolase RhmA